MLALKNRILRVAGKEFRLVKGEPVPANLPQEVIDGLVRDKVVEAPKPVKAPRLSSRRSTAATVAAEPKAEESKAKDAEEASEETSGEEG